MRKNLFIFYKNDVESNAAHDAADEWASAEYRCEVAAELAKRSEEQSKIRSGEYGK
jgi:hypothetical protein